jgi:hypothetical protein
MAKTLRGAPIVGEFLKDKQDFNDHGERIVINDDHLEFRCETVPYGFVSPDAEVWFKKFEEEDEEGNPVVREYLMTTGYLWTSQFEECARVVKNGNPQSMELDKETLSGNWAQDINGNFNSFIINDATFSKLCILGEDVEPCFEGASITAPDVSANFTEDKFKSTLFSMMQDLRKVVSERSVPVEENIEKISDNSVEAETQENQEVTEAEVVTVVEEVPAAEADFEKKEDEDEDKEKKEEPANAESEPEKEEDEEEKKKKEDYQCGSSDDDKKKKDYELLSNEFELLQTKYSTLESEYQKLVEFKNEIDKQKKSELIDSFYMLSDEDKKDVRENIANYSYDDIEAKLSIICVRKKVNFNLDTDEKTAEPTAAPSITFNLNDTESSVPAWISALKNTRAMRNN